MGINKNFVVKNGLEVNNNLIFADATNDKVGIGTTVTRATLDVRGGIAATHINLTGIATFQTLVLEGPVAAGSLTSLGSTGQYLRTTYSGVEWSSFPNFRTVQTYTAFDGQFEFPFTHTPNELDVFVNGVKLSSSEYYDSSVDVTLVSSTNQGDIVELVGYGVLGAYTGGSTINGITVLDEGTPVGTVDLVTSINFVGGDVVAAGTGAGVTVFITPTDINYIDGDARITGILTVGSSSVTINGPQNKIDTGTITTDELNVTGQQYSSLNFTKTVDNPVSIGSTEIILDSSSDIIVGDRITVVGVLTSAPVVAITTTAVTPYNRTFLNTSTAINTGIGSTAIGVASTIGVSVGSSISIVGIFTDVPVVGFSTILVQSGYVNAVLISPGFAKTTVIPINSPVGFSSRVTQKDVVQIGASSTISTGISSASSVLVQRFVNSSGLSVGNVSISAGIVTASSGIITYYGDGQYLLGVSVGSTQYWNKTSVGIHTLSNVGIGTTAKSAYSLDVNSDINFGGSLYQNGSLFVASRWTTGAGTTIYRQSRVGIGTTKADTDLHVQGDLKVTGNILDKDGNFGSLGYVLGSDGSNVSWINSSTLGIQGAQGIQGLDGIQGLMGIQGNEGYVGQDGSQGSQGVQGIQGRSNQGVQGLQGSNGTQGTQGTSVQGREGAFAGQGAQGTEGSQGTLGPLGNTGPQGVQGTQGLAGQDGVLLNVGSSGSFNVVLTSSSAGVTTQISSSDSSKPFVFDTSIPGVGIGTTTISSNLHIGAGRTTPNGAPIKVNAGSLLTTPESNAIEYDGVNLFVTQNDITNGTKRAFIDSTQFYRLNANGSDISATTAETSVSWFGNNVGVSLLSGHYYEIDYNLFFTKTTAGTCTLLFSSSSGSGFASLTATGNVTGNIDIVGGRVLAGTGQTVTMSPSASIINGAGGLIQVKGLAIPSADCRVTLKAFVSAGTITPLKDSYLKIRCLGNSDSIGNIA